MPKRVPDHFFRLSASRDRYMKALAALGKVVREEGPLDDRTGHLVQLAGAAAIRSEGAVHSHVRRALDAGATPDDIVHALILLTSTIGFPNVSAAISWAEEVMADPAAGGQDRDIETA